MSWNKWLYAALAALTLNLPNLNADCGDCCEPCFDTCDPCKGWSVYGDWLYWRTRRCDLDYATVFLPTAQPFAFGKKDVHPKYDSGFRLGITKELNCFTLNVQYTHYAAKSAETISNELSSDDFYSPSRASTVNFQYHLARGSYDIDLKMIDLLGSYSLETCLPAKIRFLGGLQFLFTDETYNTLTSSNPDDPNGELLVATVAEKTHQSTQMDAYGVTLGTEAQYDVSSCVSIIGLFSYSFLIGDIDRTYQSFVNSNSSDLFEAQFEYKDHCWQWIGNLQLNLGLVWHLCQTSCYSLDIQTGYEFHQFFNTQDFINIVDNGGRFDHSQANLGFDGLYVRLNGTF